MMNLFLGFFGVDFGVPFAFVFGVVPAASDSDVVLKHSVDVDPCFFQLLH